MQRDSDCGSRQDYSPGSAGQSAAGSLYDPKVYRLAIDLVGVDKILFGSDYPLLPPDPYFDEMKTAGLSDAEMQQVCGLNAAKLFNL